MNKIERNILSSIKIQIDELRQTEQEKYDNSPENLQYSEKIEKYQENADKLEEIYYLIEELTEE